VDAKARNVALDGFALILSQLVFREHRLEELALHVRVDIVVFEFVHQQGLMLEKVLGVEQRDDHVAARALTDVKSVVVALSLIDAQDQLVGHRLGHVLLLLFDHVGALLIRCRVHFKSAVHGSVAQLVHLHILYRKVGVVAH